MTSRDEKEKPVTDDLDDYIQEVPSHTPDFKTELAEELARLAPEAIADGKVDVEKLRELLSDDAANDGRERFGLMWPGKSRALKAAQAQTTATLVPDREASKDWDTTQNVLIEGDNLEVLKILQKHYHGKIKMIYIDPPYNTGNDFIYPDNFKEGLKTYLEWTKQVSEGGKKLASNPESAGRYHSNWLSMMYPRLKLARNLLAEDGVVFVSIGDVELGNLLRLMSEIFGETQALPLFTRVTKKSSNNGSTFSPSTDYVVGFARDISQLSPFSVALTSDQVKSYNRTDEKGRYKEIGLFQAALKHGGSRYPITAPDGQNVITPRGLPWRWSEAKFGEGLEGGQIVFKQTKASPLLDADTGQGASWNIYTKLYLSDREGVGLLPRNFSEEFQNNLGTRDLRDLAIPFDFPKPVALAKFLASIIRDSDAVVLDFFAGSGTTAHAVMELNAEDGGRRRYIQVQLPEPVDSESEAGKNGYGTIAHLARERIRRAGERVEAKLADQLPNRLKPLDVGFRAYRLSDTSFGKWGETSDVEQVALEQRLAGLRGSAGDDATPEALLTELLLKQGYSLTENVTAKEIAGLKLWSVADGAMLAIMDEHVKPSLDQLRAVVEAGAVRLVVLEDIFAGDDQLKTNLVQHAKTHGVELWSA
jgi:adenine-specific DNA-methyltransferase